MVFDATVGTQHQAVSGDHGTQQIAHETFEAGAIGGIDQIDAAGPAWSCEQDIARTLAGSPIRRIIEIDVSATETRRLLLWLDAVSKDHVVLGVQPLEL